MCAPGRLDNTPPHEEPDGYSIILNREIGLPVVSILQFQTSSHACMCSHPLDTWEVRAWYQYYRGIRNNRTSRVLPPRSVTLRVVAMNCANKEEMDCYYMCIPRCATCLQTSRKIQKNVIYRFLVHPQAFDPQSMRLLSRLSLLSLPFLVGLAGAQDGEGVKKQSFGYQVSNT